MQVEPAVKYPPTDKRVYSAGDVNLFCVKIVGIVFGDFVEAVVALLVSENIGVLEAASNQEGQLGEKAADN